jgi:hypothetical protein
VVSSLLRKLPKHPNYQLLLKHTLSASTTFYQEPKQHHGHYKVSIRIIISERKMVKDIFNTLNSDFTFTAARSFPIAIQVFIVSLTLEPRNIACFVETSRLCCTLRVKEKESEMVKVEPELTGNIMEAGSRWRFVS